MLNNVSEQQQAVLNYLKEIQQNNQTVFFIANSGNAGDCLINTATYQVLDLIGLNYVEVNNQAINLEALRGKVVLLGGGGGFVENYKHMKDLVQMLAPVVSHLVVLPQTIRGHEQVLAKLPDTVTLIVREKESYEYVLALQSKAKLLLGCDMALFTDIKKVHAVSIFKFPIKKIIRYLICCLKVSMICVFNNRQLHAMRQDSEQTDIQLKANNLDLSELLALGTQSREYNDFVSFHLFKFIKCFKEVHSNRLHVCIASMLLELPTHMYDNNYGKNKSVYEHSLTEKQCVSFIEG